MSTVPLPVVDLVARLSLGLHRGGSLLTDGERAVVDAILALDGPEALLHARLVGRKPAAFRLPDLVAAGVDDVGDAAFRLVAAGLLSTEVDAATKAREATLPVLADGCRRLGLSARGRRDDLEARVRDHDGWDDATWVRLPHRGLVVRLERWATLQVAPDRASPVLERLGLVRFVDHPVTGGGLVPSRDDWLAWEALVERGDELTVEEALLALDRPTWPPGELDLRGELRWRLSETARGLERERRFEAAEALYDALLARGGSGELEVRRARTRELAGDVGGALDLLVAASERVGEVDALAVGRAGRRVARGLGRAWPPSAPLQRPEERTLALVRGPTTSSRPTYLVGGEPLVVEEAVARRLASGGRRAVHAEGGLWLALLALLLGPITFLPVDGQLPVPRLPGPLDHGRPAFAARRAGPIWGLVDDVRAGRAGERVREGLAWVDGRRVAWVDPEVDGDALVALADGLGPDVLLAVLRPLLAEGRRAAAGLPDLAILPGEPCRVDGLHPGRLGAGVVLVEVKGEHDAERDAQRVWFDRLVRAGAGVHVWRIA